LWFGVSEAQQIAILAGATFHVVAPACADAARRVPASLLHAATNLGASRLAVSGVRARAALPGVLTAIREGVSVAWLVVVAAEFVSAPTGLGVLVLEGRDLLQPARTFLGMALLACCGALSDAGLRWVQRRISPSGSAT
jgi:sulfonate transport system permease protein